MNLHLKNLHLKNYRKFKDKKIEFQKGLNIIFGENEAGKSTISKALITVFFADPSTRARKFFSEIRNWDEAEKSLTTSNLPKLELTFEYNDKEYYLLKDFHNKVSTLESLDGTEKHDGISSVNKFVFDMFGFTSQDVYESSGFIKHEDLTNIQRTNDFYSAMHGATAQIDTGENLHQILDDIDKEIAELQKGTKSLAKNPGPIKYNMELKSELEMKLNNFGEVKDKVRITLKNKKEAAGKVEELQQKISTLEQLFENNKTYDRANTEIKALNQQLENIENALNRIEDLDAQIVKHEIQIERFTKLKDVDIDNLINEVKILEREIDQRDDSIKQIDYELKSISDRINSIKKDITIYIGIAFMVLGIVLGVVFSNIWVGIVPGIGGLLMVVWQIYQLFYSKYITKEKELKSRLGDLNSIQEAAANKLESILETYGFSSIEDIYNAKAVMISLADNIQTLKKYKTDMLGRHDIHDFRQEQTRLFLRKKEIETSILTDEVVAAKLTPDEYLTKKRELDMYKMEEKRHQQLLYTSEADIKASNISDEEVSEIQNRLEQVEKDLAYFEKRVKILTKTQEFLSKAADDTAAMVSTVLKDDMEKYLPIITRDKYKKVKIDENFDIEVFEDSYKKWIKPENNFSSGAIDQIYFLIRLAFFKLLLKKGSLFLVLDDPFVNFDANRLEGVLEILKQEQVNYQILFFTNNRNIDEGNVVKI